MTCSIVADLIRFQQNKKETLSIDIDAFYLCQICCKALSSETRDEKY